MTRDEEAIAIDLVEAVLSAANGQRFCVLAELMTRLTTHYMHAVARAGYDPHEAGEQLAAETVRVAKLLFREGSN